MYYNEITDCLKKMTFMICRSSVSEIRMTIHVDKYTFCSSKTGISSLIITSVVGKADPDVIKLFFMFNLTEHELYPAHKC